MSPPLRTGFSRLLAARLSLMHALNFLGVGFYLPFFPVWLASKGLSDVDIGYVLAIPILVRVVVASSVTGLGDRLRPNLLLALLNALAAAIYLALAPQAQLVPIAVLTALSAIALSGVVPLADVLTTEQVKAGALKDYGRVRLWCSVTFVLSNLAGGAVTWHSDIGFCGPRAYNAEVHADPYHLESPHHHYDLPQHTVPHSWAGPSRVSQDFCAAVVVETPEDETSLLARQTKNRHGPFAGIRHP